MAVDSGPIAGSLALAMFQVGDKVEYWSETYSMFMDAVVQKINVSADGEPTSFDLDVKTKANPSRIRWPGGIAPQQQQPQPQLQQPLPQPQVHSQSQACDVAINTGAKEAVGSQRPATTPRFQVGDEVEYESSTHKQWMAAKVVQVNNGGESYDLDVKKGAQARRMRHAVPKFSIATPSVPKFAVESQAEPAAPSASSEAQVLHNARATVQQSIQAALQAQASQMGPAAVGGGQHSAVPAQTGPASTGSGQQSPFPQHPQVMKMSVPQTVPPQSAAMGAQHMPVHQPPLQSVGKTASRGVSPVSGRAGLQLPLSAVASGSSSNPLPAGAQVVHVSVSSPTRRNKAPSYSPEMGAPHGGQKPSAAMHGHSRSGSPTRAQGSTTPPHPLAANAKQLSRRSLPGSGAASAWPSLLVNGRDVNQQDCTPVVCSGHGHPSSTSIDPRQPQQLRVRSTTAICTPSGSSAGGAAPLQPRPLEHAELHLGSQPFNPTLAPVRAQLLAKLRLPASAEVRAMQGFRGGLNEGVWFVNAGGGTEEFVLKLVRCNRIAQNVLTEAENLIQISRNFPQATCDPMLSFPVKIFSCLGAGGMKKHDLIVMRKVRGERLAEWIARKWYGKQMAQLLQTFEAVGAKLAEFHAHYPSVQHGDFQPSNVFYDEERDDISFIDIGGMGMPTMETDGEHFRKSLSLLAETYGSQLAADGSHRFDQGYRRVAG